MIKWKELLIPFEGYGKNEKVRILSLVIVPVIIWIMLPNHTFPPFIDILKAYPKLLDSNNLFDNFYKSVTFCLKGIAYSSVIAFIFMLLARIPIFEAFCSFVRKFRFLPSVGLSFIFMKLTNNVSEQMSWMMIFGISTFLIDSAISIALSITKDEVDYAKSLRLTRWQVFREIIIYNKAPYFLSSIIQNFAIAWMLLASVENISKSGGGIGVLLAESSKYMKLEELYAIQILILLTGILLDYVLNMIHEIAFPYIKLKKV